MRVSLTCLLFDDKNLIGEKTIDIDKRDNFDNKKKKKEKKTLFNGEGGREKKKEREKLIFPKCDPTKFHRLKHCPLYYHVL